MGTGDEPPGRTRAALSVIRESEQVIGYDDMVPRQEICDLEAALAHYRADEEFRKKAGLKPRLAWVRYDIACTLVQINGGASIDLAHAALEEALGIAQELGMVTLLKLIDEKALELEAIVSKRAQLNSLCRT